VSKSILFSIADKKKEEGPQAWPTGLLKKQMSTLGFPTSPFGLHLCTVWGPAFVALPLSRWYDWDRPTASTDN
jgi:hypothetical protein